jgi:Na+/H+ antiporter NhaD/arsenite permease-like protein
MTQVQIIFVAIVAVTLILFISEKIRIDIAAMLTLLALAATGILTPSESSPALRASPPSLSPPCSSFPRR